ncbi:MAG: hypothetical protein EXQ70_07755 [Solirubrobacterales bacterium]|nr:hypothetical protein [Solirubrobacterales bacterium]
MARVTRRRRIGVSPAEIWSVVSDPYHLPRWWPRTKRVENVSGGEPRGRRWTQVFETKDGRRVRADYRCVSAASGERYIYEQLLQGTPFDRILSSARTEIRIKPRDGITEVTLAHEQKLRGLSRLGTPMMRRATGRTLSEALGGLEEVLAGDDAKGVAM